MPGRRCGPCAAAVAPVALGDRDRDGYGDIAVGAPGNGAVNARAQAVNAWHGRAETGDVGDDVIQALDGARDTIDCGPGNDRATVDVKDRVTGCEQVTRRRR